MADPFVAEIRIVPFNFAPLGWAMCDGQLLSISQNTALFSLLGTTFGGNGTSNFALPNLQGSVPMGYGNGAGLSQRVLGETAGESAVTLLATEIPSHNHSQLADTTTATSTNPSSNLPAVAAVNARFPHQMYSSSIANAAMLAGDALSSGGSLPHNNMQPYLTLNFVIALQGIYPARS